MCNIRLNFFSFWMNFRVLNNVNNNTLLDIHVDHDHLLSLASLLGCRTQIGLILLGCRESLNHLLTWSLCTRLLQRSFYACWNCFYFSQSVVYLIILILVFEGQEGVRFLQVLCEKQGLWFSLTLGFLVWLIKQWIS